MNTQKHIESGILEAYALGLLSASEHLKVEQLINNDPLLESELLEIENALESYANLQAVPVPASLEKSILEQISTSEQNNIPTTTSPPPSTITLTPFRKLLIGGFLAFFLLKGVIIGGLAYMQYQSNQRIIDFQNQLNNINENYKDLEHQNKEQSEHIAFLRDPATQATILNGTSEMPTASAIVHWNNAQRRVLLDLSNLNAPKQGKTYQVWGLVNGKAISMGIIDWTIEPNLLELPYIPNIEQFALSIEPLGGSESPTSKPILVGRV